MSAVRRRYLPGHPLSLRQTLGGLRHGAGDPSVRWTPAGELWWASNTPDGPGVLHLTVAPAERAVDATATGPGGPWLLDGVPDLLGSTDQPEGFEPRHDVLVRARRSNPGFRVMRSRRVFDAFAAACIEQRVTGKEAFYAWARLSRRFGAPVVEALPEAADPTHPAHGMHLAPTPQRWRAIPSWEWLQAGVDRSRRVALLAGARAATGLERTLTLPPGEVEPALRTLPGVGRWTAAEVRQRAHGDPDAFSFGDYHVAKNVSWALSGQVLDDDGCAELIECYRGHRFRVQALVGLAGAFRPRRGPRFSLPTHTPTQQRP